MPEIVTLTKGDVFPSGHTDHKRCHYPPIPFRILVLLLVNWHNNFGIAQFIFLDDFSRSVGGGVIVDDDLKRKVRFLRQQTIEALLYIRPMIVGNTKNTYERLCRHCKYSSMTF